MNTRPGLVECRLFFELLVSLVVIKDSSDLLVLVVYIGNLTDRVEYRFKTV